MTTHHRGDVLIVYTTTTERELKYIHKDRVVRRSRPLVDERRGEMVVQRAHRLSFLGPRDSFRAAVGLRGAGHGEIVDDDHDDMKWMMRVAYQLH